MLTDQWNTLRHVIDTVSAGAIIGAILGLLPALAALGAIVWYLIQIYESRTFQHWIANLRMKNRARKLARLRARHKVLEAQMEALGIKKAARVAARELVEQAQAEATVKLAHDEVELLRTLPPV